MLSQSNKGSIRKTEDTNRPVYCASVTSFMGGRHPSCVGTTAGTRKADRSRSPAGSAGYSALPPDELCIRAEHVMSI